MTLWLLAALYAVIIIVSIFAVVSVLYWLAGHVKLFPYIIAVGVVIFLIFLIHAALEETRQQQLIQYQQRGKP